MAKVNKKFEVDALRRHDTECRYSINDEVSIDHVLIPYSQQVLLWQFLGHPL